MYKSFKEFVCMRPTLDETNLYLQSWFISNSFSTTGSISGMEHNSTAFVGCDNGHVSNMRIRHTVKRTPKRVLTLEEISSGRPPVSDKTHSCLERHKGAGCSKLHQH